MTPIVREESDAQFHLRMIERCERLADKLDLEAAIAPSAKTRLAKLLKADLQREYADRHCTKLAELGVRPPLLLGRD
jgi:hypothetical protein